MTATDTRSSAADANPFARLVASGPADAVVDAAVTALAAAGRPVSVPELCNTLWLERGPSGSYDGMAVTALLDDIPTVTHGHPKDRDRRSPQPAVALGELVAVPIGNDFAYAEVIWKEGAHWALDDGWVPGWLAGAPADDPALPERPPPGPDGTRVVTERLVADFGCFGPGLPPRPEQLDRLRVRGRLLDARGHLIVDAAYADGDDEADDVSFWAATVTRRYRDALAVVGVEGNAAAIADAAGSLADALAARDDVRAFGPMLVHRHVYKSYLDGDDGSLWRTVRGLAALGARRDLGWAAMSARLPHYLDPERLAGTGWPAAVVVASLLALDTLDVEAPDGDWNGVHLRLDDAWQGGGLWRAERLGPVAPVAAEPSLALGLGWVEYVGGDIARRELSLGPDDTVDAPDWFDDEDDFTVTGSEVTWTVHLTAADIDTDRLRLPARVADAVRATLAAAGQDRLAVNVAHDGERPSPEFTAFGDDGHLDVAWPLGFLPGITVRCLWHVGRTVITTATTLLPEPDEVAGVVYTHEYNLRVALAAAGLGDDARTVTIRQLVRAAVRRHGSPADDGRAALSVDAIVDCCFGPGGQVVPGYQRAVLARAIRAAVAGMRSTGAGELLGDLVVIEASASAAGRRADAELIRRYLDTTKERLRAKAARHWVRPTVITFRAGQHRSAGKDAGWAAVAGTDGLPARLGDNQTWREGHVRGGALPAAVAAELERAKRAAAALAGDPEVAAELDAVIANPFAAQPDAEGTTGTGTSAGDGGSTGRIPGRDAQERTYD
jgi:hypothetical protein